MKKGIIGLIYLSILLLGISCFNQAERVKPILQEAKTLMEQNPDSALVVLNEISDPQKLKKALYYEFYLLQIQAKDKSYKDITPDTLIFTIRDYYHSKNDIERAALATFYCGRVRQEQENYEKALKIYLGAEKYFKQSKNVNLKGLFQASIGEVYYQQLLKDEAILRLKLAADYFHQAENHRNEIGVTRIIGNSFLMQENIDSAFVYYFKALALADKHDLKRERLSVREGLGVAYREIGKWEQSETFFREARAFSSDSLHKARLSANLAYLFELQGKNDSAIYHLQKALTCLPQEPDNYLAANIYETWSAIEEKTQDFQSALEKYKLYSDYLALIFDENRNRDVIEIKEKYNYQLIENQNKQLLIERQQALLLFLLLSLALGVFILFFYRRSIHNKRKLKEAEQKVRQMRKLARNFDDKEESFRNILIRHFDILKKTALLESYLNEDERKTGQRLLRKFNEVVYGQKKLDWDVLYHTLNKLSNGFFEQFKGKFTQLDESEFRICCLIYVEFNNTEIAIILNYSINTVQAKKSAIRKKLGIKTYGNIHDFMKTAIKK